MQKLLLAALFIPVLLIGCSTEEETVSTSAKGVNDRAPKAICVPASGINGINTQVLSKPRRLFFTWSEDLEQNPSRYYEAEILVRNGNCATGEVSDIIDTHPIDIFATNVYAAH
ncbi:hypothetical protein R1T16_08665 [Flavobacterium sp. DG1-102-2]|uniref:hypothetical protein n=1 Tax=Flavobacterium sp. DG1-102-2 TaxID=3081663 RepID=UPI002948EA95|nr:hypothetical protein [Flavobacterium sp. DG1-102-2]MDV6168494.1 hypothetical protein [Flavobacterium sp. DG1-102-2]